MSLNTFQNSYKYIAKFIQIHPRITNTYKILVETSIFDTKVMHMCFRYVTVYLVIWNLDKYFKKITQIHLKNHTNSFPNVLKYISKIKTIAYKFVMDTSMFKMKVMCVCRIVYPVRWNARCTVSKNNHQHIFISKALPKKWAI